MLWYSFRPLLVRVSSPTRTKYNDEDTKDRIFFVSVKSRTTLRVKRWLTSTIETYVLCSDMMSLFDELFTTDFWKRQGTRVKISFHNLDSRIKSNDLLKQSSYMLTIEPLDECLKQIRQKYASSRFFSFSSRFVLDGGIQRFVDP